MPVFATQNERRPAAIEAASLTGPFRDFYDYWRSKRTDGAVPLRADLAVLADLPRLAPHMVVVEALSDGSFRFRLVGSALVKTMRRDLTSRRIDASVYGDGAAGIVAALRSVVSSGAPWINRHKVGWDGAASSAAEMLICPVSTDGRAVDQVVGLTRFTPTAGFGARGTGGVALEESVQVRD
ncbi:MAG: hypothetical protein JWM77_1711 [Rhodospirillales bacterium]|nr:hypothetical protein [Rhodospirillales bacterium]